MLLELEDIDTYYGQIHILQNVSLEVAEGELVCLLGGNASGKSTTLKTVLGIVHPREVDDVPQHILVSEQDLEAAQEAIEALSEPDDL